MPSADKRNIVFLLIKGSLSRYYSCLLVESIIRKYLYIPTKRKKLMIKADKREEIMRHLLENDYVHYGTLSLITIK